MDAAALVARLNQFPRLALATYPTPLERLSNLSRSLGANLWMKRDDHIGPALGGNKTRKLEFLMADAQRRGAHKVVTFGGLQSNHARITAAVARQLGMEPHLFYFEKRPRERVGNMQLNALMNAQMHFIPFGGDGINDLKLTNRLVRLLSLAVAGPSYFIPVGGHNALGCLGYVACAAELAEQVKTLGLRNPIVVSAVGTGGTLAGLVAGFALLDSPIRVIGIDVGRLWKAFPSALAQLTTEICTLLGETRRFTAREIPMIEDRYVGFKYGVPSQEGNAVIGRLAEAEGIFLDPVYTGKAMAGMIDLTNRRFFKSDETVIFLHTGGVPGLFAFPFPVVST